MDTDIMATETVLDKRQESAHVFCSQVLQGSHSHQDRVLMKLQDLPTERRVSGYRRSFKVGL